MEKIKHYSLTTPASIYDEEALTALELAGRIAAKLNEAIDLYNELSGTVDNVVSKIIPDAVMTAVDEHIRTGVFDAAISNHLNDLDKKVDNLLGSLKEGSTTLDGEVIDLRLTFEGIVEQSAGKAIREQFGTVAPMISAVPVWETGNIETASGRNYDISYRVRTKHFHARANVLGFVCPSGWSFKVFEYNKTFSFIKTTGWIKNFDMNTCTAETVYIRVLLQIDGSTESFYPSMVKGFEIVSTTTAIKDDLLNLLEIVPTWEQGTLSSENGYPSDRTNRIRSKEFLPSNYSFMMVSDPTTYQIGFACYDKDKAFISSTMFKTCPPRDLIPKNAKYIKVMIKRWDDKDITPWADTGFKMYGVMERVDKIVNDLDEIKRRTVPDFMNETLNIAYSEFYGWTLPNTTEHYRFAAHLGFNAIKGDVRITSDNVLIMNHDEGYTPTSSLHKTIIPYDASNTLSKRWIDTTFETASSLYWKEYPTDFNIEYTIPTFEDYIRICHDEGKIAYITLRDNRIQTVVSLVMQTLKKYNMVERCVINSYTFETLQEVRKYTDVIPVSQVIQHEEPLTKDVVKRLVSLGNSIVCLFFYPSTDPDALWSSSKSVIEYAQSNGVRVHMAQVKQTNDILSLKPKGVTGFQITKPWQNYTRKKYTFKATVSSAATALTVEPFFSETTPFTVDSKMVSAIKFRFDPKFVREDTEYFLMTAMGLLPCDISVRSVEDGAVYQDDPYMFKPSIDSQGRINVECVSSDTFSDGVYYITVTV